MNSILTTIRTVPFTTSTLLATTFLLAACGDEPPPCTAASRDPRCPSRIEAAAKPAVVATPPPADPLGPKPEPEEPKPFAPKVAETFTLPNGANVWLLERHALPVVAVAVAVPVGSAADPAGKAGLAHVTTSMLDEGAGSRGALDLARAVDFLGARLATFTTADSSRVVLSVMKKNLKPAFDLLGDVVVRPKFDGAEWKRVHDLWKNDLAQRASDPGAVLQVVSRAVVFGADHPYGHPVDGSVASATKTTLADAKAFYASAWRPDHATIVVVGDVTRAELAPLFDAAFGTWKKPATPVPTPVTPPAPSGDRPKLVVVDRKDAPQSNIALVRPGLAAADPDAAVAGRANTALGGSFTSRLNQDLRETHGWSYGAHSSFTTTRGVGAFVAAAAVQMGATGPALRAMFDDTAEFAKKGLTQEEVGKTRSQARAELIEQYESVETTALRLAGNAALGLPVDHDVTQGARRDGATKKDLDRVAGTYLDPAKATLVVVGPLAKVEADLAVAVTGAPTVLDENGRPVEAKGTAKGKEAAKPKDAKPGPGAKGVAK